MLMASASRAWSRIGGCLVRRGHAWHNAVRIRSIAEPLRSFSVSRFNCLPDDPPTPARPRELRPEEMSPMLEFSVDQLSKHERSLYDMMSPEDREAFNEQNRALVEEFNDPKRRAETFAQVEKIMTQIEREAPLQFEDPSRKPRGFWSDEEGEDEFALVEDADDDFNDNEMTSMAHAELELHREIREYARIAAWDMPSLSSKCYCLCANMSKQRVSVSDKKTCFSVFLFLIENRLSN